ncbi:unnamed protein product [Tenebrio molitor]|nr:unnamed protein product [Tenebrio molitor]
MYERYVILHTMTQDNLLENVDKDVGILDGSYHFSYLTRAGLSYNRKDGLRRKNLRGFPNIFVLKLKEWHGLLRQILQTLLWRVSHQEAAQLLQSD